MICFPSKRKFIKKINQQFILYDVSIQFNPPTIRGNQRPPSNRESADIQNSADTRFSPFRRRIKNSELVQGLANLPVSANGRLVTC